MFPVVENNLWYLLLFRYPLYNFLVIYEVKNLPTYVLGQSRKSYSSQQIKEHQQHKMHKYIYRISHIDEMKIGIFFSFSLALVHYIEFLHYL